MMVRLPAFKSRFPSCRRNGKPVTLLASFVAHLSCGTMRRRRRFDPTVADFSKGRAAVGAGTAAPTRALLAWNSRAARVESHELTRPAPSWD
jgi:hypothetical protein